MSASSSPSRRAILAMLSAAGVASAPRVTAQETGGTATGLVGWIEVEFADGQATFRAMASSVEPAEIEYTLSAEVEGGGGTSRTRQGGRATLADGPAALSRLAVSLTPGSSFLVTLTLHSTGGDRAEARLSGRGPGAVDL